MTYPEGGSEGMILRSNTKECICPIDTQNIQLKKIREAPGKSIKEDYQVVALLKEMEDYDREHFKVLHLDTKNRVIGIETVSIGILNQAIIHPREVLKGAILNNVGFAGFLLVVEGVISITASQDQRPISTIGRLMRISIGGGLIYLDN